MLRRLLPLVILPLMTMPATAQPDQPTWQNPPEPIVSMLDVDPLPAVSISPDNQWLLELERRSLPPISELAQPWVAIAGTKLNPQTWGPAQEAFYKAAKLAHDAGRKVALTLSDPFCVDRYREQFLALIKDEVD